MLKNLLFGGPASQSRIIDVGLLILRVSIGLMLALGHGLGKLPAESRSQMAGYLSSMNIPAPHAAAFAAMFAEFFGGLLLAIGLLTRPAAFLVAFTMFVAMFTAHRSDPLFMQPGGGAKEPALLYFLPAVLFLLAGGGRFAIDALIAGKRQGRSS